MTHVSADEVRTLARLSNLRLSSEEEKNLEEDISNILGYVEQLDELDTDRVEPTYQVTGLKNVWREDEIIEEVVAREQLLALAAESKNNQVKVPRVL